MGKSATGKDTIYEELLEHRGLDFGLLIMYTTRPIRANPRRTVYSITSQMWRGFGRCSRKGV